MDGRFEDLVILFSRYLQVNGECVGDFRDIFDAVVDFYTVFEKFCELLGKSKEELKSACLQCMNTMREIYGENLPTESARIDFSDVFSQWSYMYVYMLRHVHLVCHALDITAGVGILTDRETRRSPTVCMVGGGPGTDVLGLSVHLRKHGFITPLTSGVHVLDKCTKWKMGWHLLHLFLPTRYRNSIPWVQYHHFDYLEDTLSLEQQQIVKGANLVTMIKSISPVAAWLKTRREEYKFAGGMDGRYKLEISKWHSVYSILENMKPGAFLLYIDNSTGLQRKILMDAVKCLPFDKLYDDNLQGHRMPRNVFSPEARNFIDNMHYNPCTVAGSNDVILLRKKF